jgi:hypothetical protein
MKLKNIKIFKGRKAKVGPVHTMDISLDHLRAVFFPKTFMEKYRYLGAVPWNEEGDIFKAIEPLVIFMDYKARPKWCPRWFLRFLHLFGNDNSIVRVRNQRLSNLKTKLTKGIFLWDYKTKWQSYDLRISISGDSQMDFLVRSIEEKFYRDGYRADLINRIKELDPEFDDDWWATNKLEDILDRLENDEN